MLWPVRNRRQAIARCQFIAEPMRTLLCSHRLQSMNVGREMFYRSLGASIHRGRVTTRAGIGVPRSLTQCTHAAAPKLGARANTRALRAMLRQCRQRRLTGKRWADNECPQLADLPLLAEWRIGALFGPPSLLEAAVFT